MILFIILIAFFSLCFAFWAVVRGGRLIDHYEMLEIAVSDYIRNPENFDISHYPSVTEEEINDIIKDLPEGKRNNLQRNSNNNTDFIFDE